MTSGNRFSKKYAWFLSEATNEEIVSISKELSESLSAQIKVLITMSVSLLATTVFGLLATIVLISTISEDTSGYDTYVNYIRIAAIALMCLSVIMSFSSINRLLKAYSSSAFMWRNIRETADDEKAYEQMTTINKINILVFRCRNSIGTASMTLMFGVLLVALSYVFKILVSMGHF